MQTIIALFTLGLAAVAAVPSNSQRIVGGSLTNIFQYPSMAALLFTANWSTYRQFCGGTVINQRSILTAAHCPAGDATTRWRVRLGSSWANREGLIRTVSRIIIHPNYNVGARLNNDIAILRVPIFYYSNAIRPAGFATYNVADNAVVWAAGWGATFSGGPSSEQLRHVQIRTINRSVCAQRYAGVGRTVTANMLCSGILNTGGRDQCQGDSGGPLFHNRVVVGICSWGRGCGSGIYPGVNTRVSRYASWIRSNG